MILAFISLHELLATWNQIFFIPQSTLTLCVFRFFTGLLVISETFSWLGTYKNLLSPEGWFGYDDFIKHQKTIRFSLLSYLPNHTYSILLLLVVQFGAGLLLALGIVPQLAALVCFITLTSLHNRNTYVLSAGDTVYRFFCLFLIFAPTGTQLSILHPARSLHSEILAWPWPLVMVRLFMANIYIKNVYFKLLGEWWRKGTATQKVFDVRIWTRKKIPDWLDKLWFFKLTTYGTLVIETSLFTLIWIDEFRLAVVAVGIAFHLGLWYFLRLGFFQVAMIVGLLVFVEPWEYAKCFEWIAHFLA